MNIIDKNGLILHKIIRSNEINNGRFDYSANEQFLQVATLRHDKGMTFKPHKHKWNLPRVEMSITQECWVVIRGMIEAIYYDREGNLLCNKMLHPGDITITYDGGHNYIFRDDDCYVVEIKTGPYLGKEHDKTLI